MAKAAEVLIVGGGSRIAAALGPLIGNAATYLSRQRQGHERELVCQDYGDPPLEAWGNIACVVNCVGISIGSRADLESVNFDVACRLASAAKTAGIRHLVHVSSFSVYGGARFIDADTPVRPESDYGKSKLRADAALLALADDRFAVTIVRLPLIYGQGSLGKLGRLLRLWVRTRVLPVPTGDVSRAMIGVEMSARVLARLTTEPFTGVVFAADPNPFTYADAARARGERLYRLFIPRPLTRLVERVAPALGGRLFADCRLADKDNLAVWYGFPSELYRDIATADIH